MNFLDSYKRVENICNEKYGGSHGISSYIDDMVDIYWGYNDNRKSKFKGFRPQIFDLRANFKDEIC